MSHITKEISVMRNSEYINIKPMDTKRMLVLSLGTGAPKNDEKYSAPQAAKWGLFNWLLQDSSTPIIDFFGHASADMVDYHVSTFFQSFNAKQNYLRIQVQAHSLLHSCMPTLTLQLMYIQLWVSEIDRAG